jgi:hypothetical protein
MGETYRKEREIQNMKVGQSSLKGSILLNGTSN